VQLGITRKQFNDIEQHLDLSQSCFTDHVQPWDIRSHMTLLLRYGPSDFSSREQFESWQQRHVGVLVVALEYILQDYASTTIHVNGHDISSQESIALITTTAKLIRPDIADTPILYNDILHRFHQYINDIYSSIACGDLLPIPTQLAGEIYEVCRHSLVSSCE